MVTTHWHSLRDHPLYIKYTGNVKKELHVKIKNICPISYETLQYGMHNTLKCSSEILAVILDQYGLSLKCQDGGKKCRASYFPLL